MLPGSEKAPRAAVGLLKSALRGGMKALGALVEVKDLISNTHRHGKTLLALGAAARADRAAADCITAQGSHRHPEREAGATLTWSVAKLGAGAPVLAASSGCMSRIEPKVLA